MPSEADELWSRVTAAFSGCRTYRDQGVVTTTFFGPQKRVVHRPFSTAFVRPDRFCFEFRDRRGEEDWNQYAVWTESPNVYSWWTIRPGREQAESLSRAIAGATGVSGGAAFRIPRLLLPDQIGGRPERPGRLIEVPEAAEQGCLVIEQGEGERLFQIWIDPATGLIRREVKPRHVLPPVPQQAIEHLRSQHPERAADLERSRAERRDRPPVEVHTVTTRTGLFDEPIEDAELSFVPPEDSAA